MGPASDSGIFNVVKWKRGGSATILGNLGYLDTAETFGPIGQAVSEDGNWCCFLCELTLADLQDGCFCKSQGS